MLTLLKVFFWDRLSRKNREENFEDWEDRKALHSGQEDSLKRGNFSMLCRQLQDVSVSLLPLNILCCVADLNDVSAIGSCFLAEIRKLHYALLSCLGKAYCYFMALCCSALIKLFGVVRAIWCSFHFPYFQSILGEWKHQGRIFATNPS